MSINSILFTQSYPREPILLNVGNKDDKYESLATYLAQDSSLTSAATSAYGTDTVDLSLNKVATQLITDMAELTAETIAKYPEFENDYVLAIVDTENGEREARVYSREELIEATAATDEEKEAMREALAKEPLLVYSSAADLPPSSESAAAQDLLSKVSNFLTTNEKLLNLLDSYGYNPFDALKVSA
jgi:spore germination protein YaaH